MFVVSVNVFTYLQRWDALRHALSSSAVVDLGIIGNV